MTSTPRTSSDHPRRRAVRAVVLCVTMLGATLAIGAAGASAATPATGTIGVLPATVPANQSTPLIVFGYATTTQPVKGVLTIQVPAGFTTPQTQSILRPGFLFTVPLCQQFKVTGIAAGPAGSSVVSIAVNCAARAGAALNYVLPRTPQAGSYAFPTALTATGATTATSLSPTPTVTVRGGQTPPPPPPPVLGAISLSPATATVQPGVTQAYQASGTDTGGNSLGDVTSEATFSIAPDGTCTASTCSGTTPGAHTVRATIGAVSGTASLTVAQPPVNADLAVSQRVDNATPFFARNVVLTTIVTNDGPAPATGVTVGVPLPGGLSLVSATAGYDAGTGTWTVGSLASGATSTLVITAKAGDVVVGDRTVTATAHSTSNDPNVLNNSASVKVHSVPAPLTVTIVPFADNPPFVDISHHGLIGWTASVSATDNPSAPLGDITTRWFCSTDSSNPCPEVEGLTTPNQSDLVLDPSTLAVDTYTITLLATVADPNYTDGPPSSLQASVSFVTTNSGDDVPPPPPPLATIGVTPPTATVQPGVTQAYQASGTDTGGNSLGDVTSQATFSITPDGTCTANTCSATTPGAHVVKAMIGSISGTATLTVAQPAVDADLAVSQTVDNSAPFFYRDVVLTTTVTNAGPAAAAGVTVAVPLPNGLSLVEAPAGYDAGTGTWTVGSLAGGATTTLAITAKAGDVLVGDRTVTASAHSTSNDPNVLNDSASVTLHSVRAPLTVKIVPFADNPSPVDISSTQPIGWTASVSATDNPSAPIGPLNTQWFCDTGSLIPCPAVDGLTKLDQPKLVFDPSTLQVDTYSITLRATVADPNYVELPSYFFEDSVSFITINSGG